MASSEPDDHESSIESDEDESSDIDAKPSRKKVGNVIRISYGAVP